jgi:hypothetical protein
MDLPAALQDNGAGGITVNGSLLGQNLLQGSSGLVVLDFNGHNPTTIFPAVSGVFSTDNETVYEAVIQKGGTNGGWGNDTLTGGDGFGSVTNSFVSGAFSQDFTLGVSNAIVTYGVGVSGGTATEAGPGNTGDNFFPEGGNDVVNIAAAETGTLTSFQDILSSSGTVLVAHNSPYANWSTVWIGKYDVCNSAGPDAGHENFGAPNSGIGTIYAQAITDISPVTGEETFVDGYGNSGKDANDPTTTTSLPATTINGFHLGGPLGGGAKGDTIVFDVSSWATTPLVPGVVPGTFVLGTTLIDDFTTTSGPDFVGTVLGLVESDGETTVPLGFATYVDVATANTPLTIVADIILDDIAPVYANAAALQAALSTVAVGNILLGPPGSGVAPHTEVDILVAYNSLDAKGNAIISIADVTLTNTTAPGTGVLNTFDTAALHPVVHDLVHIANPLGLGLANLTPHNIDFLH